MHSRSIRKRILSFSSPLKSTNLTKDSKLNKDADGSRSTRYVIFNNTILAVKANAHKKFPLTEF